MVTKYSHADIFLVLMAVGMLLLGLLLAGANAGQVARSRARAESIRMVSDLQLTDLALFTEARYTRHPAMAERHAPFQEHPMALEHFPSGSLVLPPPYVRGVDAAIH
jgi:hypothetical protein